MTTNARNKTVFILPNFIAGGAERVMLTFLNRLDRSKHDPVLVVLDGKGPLREWVLPGTRIIDLQCASLIKSIPKIYNALKKEKPDIVVSTIIHLNFAVLMVRPFFPKAKFFVREANMPSSMEHGTRFHAVVRKVYRAVTKALYKILYSFADYVISPAHTIIHEFKNYLHMDTKNHVILYNPVDTDRIRGKASEEPAAMDRQEKKGTYFICVSRLHRQKGLDFLIDALKGFSPNTPWFLEIYGDGDEREKLQGMIDANGLTGNIQLMGHTNNPWSHTAAADCLLLPSIWEGMPNVVLESLCVGTPVIAMRRAGGVGEISELAPPGSVLVADTMDEFVGLMGKVQAVQHNIVRQSLLPDEFQVDTAVKNFHNILALPKAR